MTAIAFRLAIVFRMTWTTYLGQSIGFTTIAFLKLWQHDFLWALIYLTLALGFVLLVIRDRVKIRQDKLRQRRVEEMLALSRELRTAVADEEFWQVVEGELSLPELRKVLLSRQKVLWSHARTDCRFFSGSVYLKCAVNPGQSCEGCRCFEST